jgi:MYXO-CTERM domain-containing protein
MKKVLRTITGLALVACTGTALAAPMQWTIASGGNDHWYEFVATPSYWSDAQAAALGSSWMDMPGYLVTLTSAGENAFMSSLPGFSTAGFAWIGGSDVGVEGQWFWMNGPEAGQPFSYTNWGPGEPNNVGGIEHYAHLQPPVGNPSWNDLQNAAFLGYIVEYSVPTPGSLPLGLLALGALGLTSRRRRSATMPTR